MFLFRSVVLTSSFFALARGQAPSDSVTVGQEICAYGYVMDEYCIDFGLLLDNQQFETLENPEEHSVHCLVDVSLCYETPFHILTDPEEYQGNTTYGPGWAASDNALLLTESRRLGDPSAGCSECTGEGTVHKGLRFQVQGTVVTVDPPVLNITTVQQLMEGEKGCMEGGSTTTDSSTNNGDTTTDAPADAPADGGETTEAPEALSAASVSTWVLAAVLSGAVLVMS